MSDDLTVRLSLPMLHPGQAQKEMTHNEALTTLDLIVQPMVETVGATTPPPAPSAGACWIVGPTPSGAWAGHADALAGYTDAGWRFVAATEGMTVWCATDAAFATFRGGGWRRGEVRAAAGVEVGGLRVLGTRSAAIPGPSGGTMVDAQARTVVNSILGALREHGLIAS